MMNRVHWVAFGHCDRLDVGPPLNLSAQSVSCSCSILPPSFPNGWGGIGIGGQATTGTPEVPGPEVFAVWPNATWRFAGRSGTLPQRRAHRTAGYLPNRGPATVAHADSDRAQGRAETFLSHQTIAHNSSNRFEAELSGLRWFNLSLVVTPRGRGAEMSVTAAVDGRPVLTHVPWAIPQAVKGAPFVFLASSYSAEATGDAQPNQSNAEFRDLCFKARAAAASRHTMPSPPPPPAPPAPKVDGGLQIAECKSDELAQLWVFSGEDGGEAGMLRPQSNGSLCLDALQSGLIPTQLPIRLRECGATGSAQHAQQLWHFDSTSGVISSVVEAPCLKRTHGLKCHVCLGYQRAGSSRVDLWDCNNASTETWDYDVRSGGAQITKRGEPGCLVAE